MADQMKIYGIWYPKEGTRSVRDGSWARDMYGMILYSPHKGPMAALRRMWGADKHNSVVVAINDDGYPESEEVT